MTQTKTLTIQEAYNLISWALISKKQNFKVEISPYSNTVSSIYIYLIQGSCHGQQIRISDHRIRVINPNQNDVEIIVTASDCLEKIQSYIDDLR
jgi:hypothetical protein